MKPLCLSASFSFRSKSSLDYLILLTPNQLSWSCLPPTYCTWTRLLSCMLHTQLTWHFHWGNICILFILGNRCTSCCFCFVLFFASSVRLFKHTPNTIYEAFQLEYLRPIYFRKQFYFLWCHPRNSTVCQKGLQVNIQHDALHIEVWWWR